MNLDYKKYRWFFTSSGKLVYGGKSALQNEEVVKTIMKEENKIVMHTQMPGSPFAVIDSPLSKVSEEDLEETAIWTACFSRAWRSKKIKAEVHIFSSNQIYKDKTMKEGTFGILGKVEKKEVKLKLCLILQENVLRAVPEKTAMNKEIFEEISPGKIEKEKYAAKLAEELKRSATEVLNALPSGAIKSKWQK